MKVSYFSQLQDKHQGMIFKRTWTTNAKYMILGCFVICVVVVA